MHELAIYFPLASATASTPAAPATASSVERPSGTGVVATDTGAATSTAPAGTGPATTQGGAAGNTGASSPLGGMVLPIILMLVALYFFLFRGQRKDEKRRKGMIAELKKGDRVMTIGGMLAKVVSVEGDEVVLKIDEAANVKASYRKSAIQEVIVDKEEKK